MGFFDEYKDLGGGGLYMKAGAKQFLIDNGVVFEITGLALDEDNKFGPRYVAFCSVPNADTGEPEDAKISFPIGTGVDSRDSMLKQMEAYLDTDDPEPVFVKLAKVGRAIMIASAEPVSK